MPFKSFRENRYYAVLEKIVIFTRKPRSLRNYSPDIETKQLIITSKLFDAIPENQFNIFHSLPKSLLINRVTGNFTLVEYKDGIVKIWFWKGLLILSFLYQGRGYNVALILSSWSGNRDRDWNISKHFKIVVLQNCHYVKSVQIRTRKISVFGHFSHSVSLYFTILKHLAFQVKERVTDKNPKVFFELIK